MQKITTLGNIQSVDLRDCWEYEDKDFTPWLAQEENIKLLGDTIDMDLEVESQEVNVGPFRADILCKDSYDHYVLIENQLELTDHRRKILNQKKTFFSTAQTARMPSIRCILVAKSFRNMIFMEDLWVCEINSLTLTNL